MSLIKSVLVQEKWRYNSCSPERCVLRLKKSFKLLDFSKSMWYNKYAKPTEYFSKDYFYLQGIVIPFCCRVNNEFVKNANSYWCGIISDSFCFSVGLATIGVCVFGAVYFGSRTFLYADWRIYEQKYSEKDYRYYRHRTYARRTSRLSWKWGARLWVLLRR